VGPRVLVVRREKALLRGLARHFGRGRRFGLEPPIGLRGGPERHLDLDLRIGLEHSLFPLRAARQRGELDSDAPLALQVWRRLPAVPQTHQVWLRRPGD
jgi:hypothetical protein